MISVNVEKIRETCRKEAQKWLNIAEEQNKRIQDKNNFVSKSGQMRKQEALQVAQQLMEVADGRRGVLARNVKNIFNTFKGKRKRPYALAIGYYGKKIGGYIGKKGIKPIVALEINRDFTAQVNIKIHKKIDAWYGD